ncbi:MAG: sigma-54-dependent transcriptional regulator [Thermodesulfobacteriota bacterium]
MIHSGARILIVDDEKDFCDILLHLLKREGFSPLVAHDGETALEMTRAGMPDALLLDVKMPGIDGLEVLRRAKKLDADLPILMITAYGGLDGAVQAIKEGAYDYLAKPLDNRELIEKLKRALVNRAVSGKKPPHSNRQEKPTVLQLHEIMGPSDAIRRLISDVRLVAPSDFTVVIQGETGSGKELVAQAIHRASLRPKNPMVPLDCAAIPESLFESELFGHERGAFTSAVARGLGKFEMAQGGTLFLDEVTNMPLNCQIKLLRAIQEKTFFRVGGREPVTVDVRLLVATNQDLNAAVSKGLFSRDLFYRLSEFTIIIPPLRERKEDVIHLSNRFLKATNLELNKKVRGISDSALQALLESQWPGNVRQLRSVIRRAVLLAEDLVQPDHLVFESSNPVACAETRSIVHDSAWDGLPLKEIVRRCTSEVERRVLTDVLRKTRGNKAEAARILQIDYKTIHSKVKQYGINLYAEDDDGKEE